MTRRMLWIPVVLALAIIASAPPAHAQCTPLTLTVNGSSSATVHPGDMLTVAGTVSNCGSQAANISVTLTITRSGFPLASYTKSFQLQPGQTQPESTSFRVPNAPGTYVGTATSSNGGSATATVTVV
ncbi:MAG TPA: hypothetical protein VE778_05560 [Candidatus Bathyarchaeia archaeon]|nr:hypothetical protein [Candidatus Bathyarchaeia archaeon]